MCDGEKVILFDLTHAVLTRRTEYNIKRANLEVFAYFTEFLGDFVGIIVGVIVPPRLEGPDAGGQLLDIGRAFRIRGIKGDGLLSQSLNC